ncbi:MAG: DUF1501 domain-containing protein [Planctomycetes bacterium]|nr:DUF1501 domain-containing protein [Planctomycetota bacterium]
MLRITGEVTTDCDGISRRGFVQAGLLGVGGLGLAEMFKLRAEGAVKRDLDTNVILFWLSGGPGHMETWDPKPEAPVEFRGPLGAIGTSVPGVAFGELLPETAGLMEHLAILRTVNHGSGDHTKGNHWMLTGFEGPDFNGPDNRIQRRPSMGSAAARLRGANQPGMPPYVGAPHLRGGTDNLFHYAAYLGGGHNPFVVNSDPNETDYAVKNLTLPNGLPMSRLENRRELLKSFDRATRQLEPAMTDVDEHLQNAFNLLSSAGVRDAFDITAEPVRVRDAYGRHTFGQSALLARRLVERGVTFATVNCVPWDHHGSANRFQTEKGAKLLIPPLDRAMAALIRDLIDRGMYEKTLIVAMGEFGRTPRMNQYAGRDHWGRTFSVLMGGGGMQMGQVIGRSNSRGEHVVERPLTPQDVAATVYHHLGIDARSVTFRDRLDRPMYLLDSGKPIRELFG